MLRERLLRSSKPQHSCDFSRVGGLCQSKPSILGTRLAGSAKIQKGTTRRLCRKVVDTPFPFPWAQAVTITLLLFCITAPFLIAAFTTTVVMSALMTFVSVHTYMMLNEVRACL